MNEPEIHKRSKKIDLQKVEKYFSRSGYKTLKLEQLWRHITRVLVKENKKHFLKMASTKEVSQRTKNEYEWNELINSRPNKKRLPVIIPINYKSGEYNGLFWFLSEYAGDKLLARPEKKNKTKDLEDQLANISKAALEIMNLKTNKTLPLDEHLSPQERKNKFFQKLQYWNEQTTRDLSDLIELIENKYRHLRTAPCHGDLVPWHFIRNDLGELYLIDGESARMSGPKFYDVAYFYHRVYTKLKRPDIACKFIDKVILAQRLVGGYFDAERDNITSISLQDSLKTKLKAGSIL